jgi:hypothetical protein
MPEENLSLFRDALHRLIKAAQDYPLPWATETDLAHLETIFAEANDLARAAGVDLPPLDYKAWPQYEEDRVPVSTDGGQTWHQAVQRGPQLRMGSTPLRDRWLRQLRGIAANARARTEAEKDDKKPPRGEKRPSKIATAMALLQNHPTWTNEEIAERVPCNAKYLSQHKGFKAARKVVKDAGRSERPKGSKDRDGNLEAEF